MLDIKWIRDNPGALAAALQKRGWNEVDARSEEAKLAELDDRLRALVKEAQANQASANTANSVVGALFSRGLVEEANEKKAEAARLKETKKQLEMSERKARAELDEALAGIPNVPLDDVPPGLDEHGNVEKSAWGTKPTIADPKEHYELGEALGMMDFETAAKLSGSRFVVLKAGLARLERALGQFMLDLHTTEHGYTEVQPPFMVKDEAMFGTAQLPKFVEDQFHFYTDAVLREHVFHEFESIWQLALDHAESHGFEDARIQRAQYAEFSYRPNKDRYWLIPTAEVPLTNLVREAIQEEEALPLRFTALTPCFRAEAGSAGRDTRGMLRQHQFDKVEMVSITTPEESGAEHERMLACAEEVLRRLDIHYRVMTLCTGDMGFGAQKTYDIEAWLPGQGTYREISSCSVCGDFQARRMKARYRPKEGKGTRLVHTLNGSGVAVGRALIAVMENYQNPDGSITVPDALRPYMGGVEKVGG